MLDFAKKLYDELISQLKESEEEPDQRSISPDYRLNFITNMLDRLKESILADSFGNEHEEILFFKSGMPLFLSQLIYYKERVDLESMELTGSSRIMEATYERISEKISRFFTENTEFYKYYRSGKTIFDPCYYLRKSPLNQDNMFLPGYKVDESFCTVYSIKLATILAYARLEKDIRLKLTGDERKEVSGIEEYKLKWTASKT